MYLTSKIRSFMNSIIIRPSSLFSYLTIWLRTSIILVETKVASIYWLTTLYCQSGCSSNTMPLWSDHFNSTIYLFQWFFSGASLFQPFPARFQRLDFSDEILRFFLTDFAAKFSTTNWTICFTCFQNKQTQLGTSTMSSRYMFDFSNITC